MWLVEYHEDRYWSTSVYQSLFDTVEKLQSTTARSFVHDTRLFRKNGNESDYQRLQKNLEKKTFDWAKKTGLSTAESLNL